ncbi:MAG: type II toxin-antitoxin system RelE/ParE family toxin [Chloroflexi bacterium]|nr:type II toxin-antitoxin system RelE/ParE family toxin [Chloroflexota bacterium]
MTVEIVITESAERDLGRLDRQVARRVAQALQRYADEDLGNVRRLRGEDELRLRVGDWRVRFREQWIARPANPPSTGMVQVKVITVLRVLPHGRAYRAR